MKKLGLFILLSFFIINTSFAAIEDDSIIEELDLNKVEEIAVDFKLKSFESCDALEDVMGKYVKAYWKNNKSRYNYPVMYRNIDSPMIMEDSAVEGVSVKSANVNSVSSESKSDFSKTNTQVLGVDESDIVKTDGDYIYYYNDSGNYEDNKYVYIVNQKTLKVVKKIKVPKFFYGTQLYVSENRLVILASGYSNRTKSKYNNYWVDRENKTYTIVYDTEDKNNPELKKLYINDGTLSKSRKIGKYIYVISNNYFNIPYYSFKNEEDIVINSKNLIPNKIDLSKTSDKSKQNFKVNKKTYPFNISGGKVANCNDIEYVLPDLKTLDKVDFNPSYNIVSIIDIENTENSVKTKVIAGNSSEIYMSLQNLYITDNIYSYNNYKCPENARCIMPYYYGGSNNTLIHKLGIKNDTLNYENSNIVPGSPLTQYSMDENDEKFRIITNVSTWGKDRKQHTNLYILDENLEKYSSLEGLGDGERFQSSRFIGDKLFLVTFKQVDPLFAIDLSNPKEPTVLGELKIPGYSTYLHPYDDNHLIGLGYDTYENKWGGTRNGGVKLDLYEINYDKKCGDDNLSDDEIKKCEFGDYKGIIVKQKFTKSIGDSGSYSEALRNPRMFMWNNSKNTLLLPASIYINESKESYNHIDFFNGLISLDIDKNSGISENHRVTHIDKTGLKEKRDNECKKYLEKNDENNECKKLIDGSTYCPSRNNYVPSYCYEDSTLGSYIASKSWEYKDSLIKRALWIGNTSYAISNEKITSHDFNSGEKELEVDMK